MRNSKKDNFIQKMQRTVPFRWSAFAIMATLICVSVWGCCHTRETLVLPTVFTPKTDNATVVKFEGEISADWINQINNVAKDANTKIIVLWIDSPGGTVTDARLLSHGLKVIKEKYKKPIYIYSDYQLASGAYWIACEADSIYVSPAASVGAIGVYMMREDISRMDSTSGDYIMFFYGGEHKLWGNIHCAMDSAEYYHDLKLIKGIYKEFCWQVFLSRFNVFHNRLESAGLPSDTVTIVKLTRKLASGESYKADDALEYGLIDGVYYFNELCNRLRAKGLTIRTPDGTKIDLFYPGEYEQ